MTGINDFTLVSTLITLNHGIFMPPDKYKSHGFIVGRSLHTFPYIPAKKSPYLRNIIQTRKTEKKVGSDGKYRNML